MTLRQCGDCNECCVAIECVGTAAHEPCAHLGKRGCTIYDERPKECRAFRCLWLDGHGTAFQRPDKIGVMANLAVNRLVGGAGLNVVECRPHAFKRNRLLVERLKREKFPCVMLEHYDGRKTVCSRDKKYMGLVAQKNGLDIPADSVAIEMQLSAEVESGKKDNEDNDKKSDSEKPVEQGNV